MTKMYMNETRHQVRGDDSIIKVQRKIKLTETLAFRIGTLLWKIMCMRKLKASSIGSIQRLDIVIRLLKVQSVLFAQIKYFKSEIFFIAKVLKLCELTKAIVTKHRKPINIGHTIDYIYYRLFTIPYLRCTKNGCGRYEALSLPISYL